MNKTLNPSSSLQENRGPIFLSSSRSRLLGVKQPNFRPELPWIRTRRERGTKPLATSAAEPYAHLSPESRAEIDKGLCASAKLDGNALRPLAAAEAVVVGVEADALTEHCIGPELRGLRLEHVENGAAPSGRSPEGVDGAEHFVRLFRTLEKDLDLCRLGRRNNAPRTRSVARDAAGQHKQCGKQGQRLHRRRRLLELLRQAFFRAAHGPADEGGRNRDRAHESADQRFDLVHGEFVVGEKARCAEEGQQRREHEEDRGHAREHLAKLEPVTSIFAAWLRSISASKKSGSSDFPVAGTIDASRFPHAVC